MGAIEDKLNFFEKIVREKIEKENQEISNKLNDECAKVLQEKREEFKKEAEQILNNGFRDIQKEKLQIISKARVDEKRILLEKRKEIFNEVKQDLLNYTKTFMETDKYKNILFKDLTKALEVIDESHKFELYFTQRDIQRFKDEIDNILDGRKVELCVDDELLGGFVILNRKENAKFDMSIFHRIHSSKDIIGEKLYEILQQEVK